MTTAIRHRQGWRLLPQALIAALLLMAGVAVWAQTEDDEAEEEPTSAEAIEEIVVVGGRSGDRRSLDDIYADELRERILNDIEQMRVVEEEIAWRSEDSRLTVQPTSRMTLGYDPRDEVLLRSEMDLTAFPTDTVRPASVIRIGF